MRCRMIGGAWAEAEKLPRQVNCGAGQFNAFIDPDERYIIVCVAGRSDSLGGDDYYIVFHNEEDRWSEPVNMGAKVNTPGRNQFSPYVTPDGRYFFFMSSRLGIDEESFALTADSLMRLGAGPGNGNSDIYWVDASFIDALRPAGF